MTTKPQCTTQAECYRKYADWLEACEGINPFDGVLYKGIVHKYHPTFIGDAEDYEIALGVLDGKIVWRDSVLYLDNGAKIDDELKYVSSDDLKRYAKRLSWNQPRQTITINGKEGVKPIQIRKYECQSNWTVIEHSTTEDAQQFRYALK